MAGSEASTRSARPGSGRQALGALAIALVTLAAYLPVADNGYIWDDGDYVTHNDTLTSLAGLPRIWLEPGALPQYYPLVHTSFWLEYRLWGLAPLGYHLVNVVLHAFAALLLWRVLVALRVPGAWWAAAIFALHPVQVESVAWITERKNVLSGVFYFAALLSWIHWADLGDRRGGARGPDRLYAVSVLCFALALLSKTVTATLPAVIVVSTWWKGRPLDRAIWQALAPLFVLGIGFGLFTAVYEQQLVGAAGAQWDWSVVERVLIAGRALWFYLGKLAWPHPLVFNYPRWKIDAAAAWQYAYPLAALALGVGLWWARGRIGRGALAAALVFAGTLVPALGFFAVYPMRYAFVADHFQYLASAAPIAWTAAVVATWARRSSVHRTAWAAIAASVLLALGSVTWQQTQIYRDAETLWRATLRDNPDSWLAHSHLCAIEQERGRLERARVHCNETLRLEPDNAETHHLLAILAVARGDDAAAIAHFERALAIEPDFLHARSGYATVLNTSGRHREAIAEFRRILAAEPDYAQAHTNLGNALAAVGETEEAIRHHRRAIELQPDLAAAHNNLAVVLIQRGELRAARDHLERAAALEPDSVEAQRRLRAIERRLKP